MFLNIKTLLCALFISTITVAQQTETDVETESQPEKQTGHKIGNILIGAYFPIAFGNNFVNDGHGFKRWRKICFKSEYL